MHRALKFIVPLALAAAAVPMAAQMPMAPFGKPDRSLVSAGSYAADPNHTLVEWQVNHLGFNDYFGLFGMITGTLMLDPAHPAYLADKFLAMLDAAKISQRVRNLLGRCAPQRSDCNGSERVLDVLLSWDA